MFDAGMITIAMVGFVQVPPSVGISAPVAAKTFDAGLNHMAMTRRIPRRRSILNMGSLFPDYDAVLLWVVCRDFPIRSFSQNPFSAYGMACCGKTHHLVSWTFRCCGEVHANDCQLICPQTEQRAYLQPDIRILYGYPRDVMSDKRFVQGSGINAFNGNELIVKGALESKVGLMAGYPGSPVAEVFTILEENAEILRECGLWGEMTNDESQGAAALNGALDVGVNAVAVMKSVGLNVAADPINIINYADKLGLSGKRGGALVVCGDDPHASSTQVAGDSRQLMQHLKMPVMEPSTPQELKDWIGEALKLSIFSNLVVGYLITTYLAEGGGNVRVYENQPPEISFKNPISLDISKIDIPGRVSIPPNTWDLEKEIIRVRFPKVNEYVRQNKLNKLLYSDDKTRHRIGFVAAGISYSYLEQALWELGCDKQFPLLKLAVTFPIEPEIVEQLAGQVDNIIVVEEKRPFIENQIKGILRDLMQAGHTKTTPQVYGKAFPDEDGLPEEGGFTPSMVIEKVGRLVMDMSDPASKVDQKRINQELDLIAEIKAYGLLVPPRTPGFCAGCPHRETLSAVKKMREQPAHKDIFAHGDIGCYSMSFLPPFAEMYNLTAMGLGGAAGSGMDPFVTNKQYALMGDSTFFWRGITAISNSIKEGQDILYIILDNKTTAMTGHQPTPASGHNIMGDKTVAQDIEGIVKAMGRPKSKDSWDRVSRLWNGHEVYVKRLPPSNRKRYMAELDKAFEKPGVKVVIADKECGITFHRRKRAERAQIVEKQGFVPHEVFVNISQEVCENCRECTKGTGCPGLTIIDTDYGEKIGIDQSTCVSDTYCTKIMACPSFEKVIVTRNRPPIPRVKKIPLDNIPPPARHEFTDTWSAFISGVAGMMNYPADVEDNIRKHTNSDEYLSGRIGEISELYYGNKLFTNIILLGMAFQIGLIPVSEKNLLEAIMETVSPGQRTRNAEAFELGRKFAAEPEYLEFKNIVADNKILRLFGTKESYIELLARKSDTIAHSYWMWWKGEHTAEEYRTMVEDAVAKLNLDEETNRNLARRVYDMIMWGGLDHARRYVDRILEVFAVDRPEKNYAATKSAILNLAKVSLIKDEIYTPLLLTDDEKLERDKIRYNIDEENGDRIMYEHINRPEFEVFGRQLRFNLPGWLAHNWLMNLFKHAKFTRGILTRWGWHKKELGFRNWNNDQVIGFFLRTAPTSYELALRALRVINDPYRPNEFAVTGFREIIYPKMEKARKEFEQLIGASPPLPEIPVLAS